MREILELVHPICGVEFFSRLDRGVFPFFSKAWVSLFPPPHFSLLRFFFSLSSLEGEKNIPKKQNFEHTSSRSHTASRASNHGRDDAAVSEGGDLFFSFLLLLLRRPLLFDLIALPPSTKDDGPANTSSRSLSLPLALRPRLALRPLSCVRLSTFSATGVEIYD